MFAHSMPADRVALMIPHTIIPTPIKRTVASKADAMVMLRITNCRTEKRAQPRPESLRAHSSHLQSIALEHLIVARATTASGCGTVGIDRWGGARSDCLSQWAAARDFLFLGRSRCCSGGAQNNDSGQRKYHPDRHFRLLVRSGVLAALPSTQTPAASDHSINHEPPAMDQGRQPCNDFKGRSGRASQQRRAAHVRFGSLVSEAIRAGQERSPLYLRKRTSCACFDMSALCQ